MSKKIWSSRRDTLSLVAVALLVLVAGCAGADRPTVEDAGTTSTSTSATESPIPAPSVGPGTVTLTPAGETWFDPEVLSHDGRGWITWQDDAGGVFLAELDLEDGTVVDGSTVTIAQDGAPLADTFNGPELGLDEEGISVWYTAVTGDGPRVVRVGVAEGAPVEITSVTGTGYVSPMPSRRADAATTKVVALRRPPGFGTAVWFDEAAPQDEVALVTLPARDSGDARWIVGTDQLVVAGDLAGDAQLALVDVESGAVAPIDVGDAVVDDPYGWVDPATGQVSVLAVVGGSELVVWSVDEQGAPTESARFSSPRTDHPYLGSPEPFVLDGRAWVSLTLADEPVTVPGRTDQEIWLLPLDGTTPRRCDDGAGPVVTRVDPEVIVADAMVFVYSYAWDGSTSTVQRCAVDLRDGGVGSDDAVVAAPGGAELTAIEPSETAPGIAPGHGQHLVGAPEGPTRGELLVFFPGTGASPDDYTTFLGEARALGYHVVALAYPNDLSVNFDLCQGSGDPTCPEAARDEILWGLDAPGLPLDIPPVDAAVPRLVATLEYLERIRPAEGWGQYLDDGGSPVWSRIATAGHSQGGGHAAFLAVDHELARVVLLDATEPAAWTDGPMATPSDRMWGLAHAEEPIVTPIERSWELLGLPGDIVVVEDAEPPWGDSHRLVTATDGCQGDPGSRGYHHNCPVVDDFLPVPLPTALRAAWEQLLTG